MLISYYQVYEPVGEGSYIKMIDKVSGHGGQIQVSTAWIDIIAPFKDHYMVTVIW